MRWKYITIALVYILVFATTVFAVSDLQQAAQPAQLSTPQYPGIVIDAGHGGMDGGAVAADGTVEKEINLAIAQKLQTLFELCGFEVIMTREDDTLSRGDEPDESLKTADIHRRLAIAEANPDCMFISIHQNQFSVPKYKGTQVFYSPNREESEALAATIQDTVVSMMQKENYRQAKPTGKEIYILYHTTVPAVMVECGFLSNPEERDQLKTEEYQDQMAFSILCGIFEYCCMNT